MEVSYRSDLYEAGRDEDGEMVYGEAFYAYVELADGSRYAHSHSFPDTAWADWEVPEGEEGPDTAGYYACDQAAAVAKVEALVAKIKAAGDIDLRYWNAMEASYGSVAYQQQVAAMSPSQRGYGR